MPGHKCVYRCCSSRTGGEYSLFNFPKDISRCEAWLKASQREDLRQKNINNFRLCEKYFEKKFINISGRKRLFQNSIPTVFCNSDHSCHLSIDTDDSEPAKKFTILSGSSSTDISSINVAETSATNTDGCIIIKTEDADPKHNDLTPTTSSMIIDETFSVGIRNSSVVKNEDKSSPSELGSSICGSSSKYTNTQTQTPQTFIASTSRIKKMKCKIRSLQRRLNTHTKLTCYEQQQRLEHFKRLCDKYLNHPFAETVKIQADLKNKKPKGRRYSQKYKQFALTLYFSSPKAYKFIEQVLQLPTKRCLEKMTANICCKPGLNNQCIFDTISIKVQKMSELDKYCIICIDETALKTNLFFNVSRDEIIGFHDIGIGKKEPCAAQNVAVIMARGLFHNWKQPVAYFFVNTQLKATEMIPILKECIEKLTNTGLQVQGILSDMRSNFIQLSKMLGVTEQDPEFQLGDFKLIYFFDPPHLQKATKTNLMTNSFHFDDKKTSWEFVEDFYNQDKKQFYRCAPKLTKFHIYPTGFEKMKVKFAVQVLSRTVASGMYTYMGLGALPPESLGTIEVIEKFDKLFDILNSTDFQNPNKYKNVYEGSDFQKEFLEEMWLFLKNMKIHNLEGKDITFNCKFRTSWMITIKGIQVLWQRLSKVGFKYIKTRINQDYLENLFGDTRQQGRNCINLSPNMFEKSFRKLFSQNFLQSDYMNCEDDLGVLLTQININESSVFETNAITTKNKIAAIKLPDHDYRNENITLQNSFSYVCDYLINKALQIHKCEICIQFANETKTLSKSTLFTNLKAYDNIDSCLGSLKTSNEKFIYFIYKLEKIFQSQFDELSLTNVVSKTYFTIMQSIPFTKHCKDFPLMYVIKLFIRLRIFYTLKYTNRHLSSSKKDEKTDRKITIPSLL